MPVSDAKVVKSAVNLLLNSIAERGGFMSLVAQHEQFPVLGHLGDDLVKALQLAVLGQSIILQNQDPTVTLV